MRFILTAVAVLGCGVVCLADYEKAPEPENVPELMVTRDGRTVRTVADWETVRRPEIVRTMAEEVFGVRPVERPANLRFEVLRTESAFGGKAVRKLVRGTYAGPGRTFWGHALLSACKHGV